MVASLRASALSFAYGGGEELFRDLSFHLCGGFAGVVGENGTGKTTLLRLVAGALTPTAGALHVEPPDAVIASCPQTVGAADPAVSRLAGDWSRSAQRLIARFDLDPDGAARWSTLSPGERKRWQIAAALFARPDVLLLDEPTNHIDAATRSLLVDRLAGFRGVGLVVSHDRALLDALTTSTLWLADGTATLYPGPYRDAATQREAERSQRAQRYDEASRVERVERRRAADAQRRRASAESAISTRRRSKGPGDSDARTMAARNLARWAEASHARTATRARHRLERATEAREAVAVTRQRGRSLFVDWRPPSSPTLLRLDRDELSIGGKLIARDLSLRVGARCRIHLAGDNGAGKTTLLRALLDGAGDAEIFFLPQESTDDPRPAIASLARDQRLAVENLTAALGLDPQRALRARSLSPGERRKLLLAQGLSRQPSAIVLDEPTNHLDLPSILRLQGALELFPGALVLVTHDDALAAAVTTTTWQLEHAALEVRER